MMTVLRDEWITIEDGFNLRGHGRELLKSEEMGCKILFMKQTPASHKYHLSYKLTAVSSQLTPSQILEISTIVSIYSSREPGMPK